MDDVLLIFHLRPARRDARATATAEALSLLGDLSASAPAGGPLSDQGGLFWISLPTDALERARERFPLLGYTNAVDILEPVARGSSYHALSVRWRRRTYLLIRLYEEEPGAVRESAPDRRTFTIEDSGGTVRVVRGYRGGSGPLSRRGLPVPDARMLVNLARAERGGAFLDPFAGAGGIIIEARERGYRVLSCDLDPALRYGLTALGAAHAIADASRLPYRPASIDAIATEPPYEPEADGAVIAALGEMGRILRTGGRMAMLCAARQADGIRGRAGSTGLSLCHDSPINRKGLDCAVLAWEKR